MASSPAEGGTATRRGEALQEVTTCWDQAYEALARGDLERVAALLDIAGDYVPALGDGAGDSPAEAHQRALATSAFGRLRHGMQAGLTGLQDEMARSRNFGKLLRGYGDPRFGIGINVERII
jgi:hypothetical protein